VTLDFNDAVNLVLGVLYLVLAAIVLRHIGRFGRAYPWLGLLTLFFLFRGAERVYAAVTENDRLGIVADVLLIFVVILLILGIDKTVNALRSAQDEAAYRREEYARALADYKRLARHRLANPITAIRGSISALRDMPDLDPDTRQQLLEAAEGEARRIEQVALDPESLSEEEHMLQPQPDV
jgi:signal transduction histidine kinase